jgi:putative membrane protein
MPRPNLLRVLTAWQLAPLVLLALLFAGWAYLFGVRRVRLRYPRAPWPATRVLAFLSGLAMISVALQGPVDAYAGVLLWVHMIQHLLLIMVAAPLVLLGRPVTLLLRGVGLPARERLRAILHGRTAGVLSNPVAGAGALAAVLVGTHFSPFYEQALEHPPVHDREHLAYLAAALLFWWPIVGLDPGPKPLGYPMRIPVLLAGGVVNVFVALAIYSSNSVLYPHYALVPRTWGPSPLADQQAAGAIMWLLGSFAMLPARLLVAGAWYRSERRAGERLNRRLDAIG